MAYFADGAPCDYFGRYPLTAMGWLEPGSPYSRGDVDDNFVRQLVSLAVDTFEPFVRPSPRRRAALGSRAERPRVQIQNQGHRKLPMPSCRTLGLIGPVRLPGGVEGLINSSVVTWYSARIRRPGDGSLAAIRSWR
jgi:hypothetical protein